MYAYAMANLCAQPVNIEQTRYVPNIQVDKGKQKHGRGLRLNLAHSVAILDPAFDGLFVNFK